MTDLFHANSATQRFSHIMADLIRESGRYSFYHPKKWECTCRFYALINLYPTVLEHARAYEIIKNNMMHTRQFIETIRHSPLYETFELYVLLLTEQMEAVDNRMNAIRQDDRRVEGEEGDSL